MKGNKNYRPIVIGGLIIILLVLIYQSNQGKLVDLFNDIKGNKIDTEEKNFLELSENFQAIGQYKNYFMTWNNEKLTRLDSKGVKVWEKEFYIDNPILEFGNNNIFIGDRDSGEIYLLEDNGETIDRINIDTTIVNLKEIRDYLFVIIKEEDLESLLIYDIEGNLKSKVYLGKVNTLTMDILEDKSKYCLGGLEVDEEGFKSKIFLINIEGDILDELNLQDEVIILTRYIDENRIIVATNTSLYLVRQGQIIWDRKIEDIKDIKVGENIVLMDEEGLSIVDFLGKTLNNIDIGDDYNKIILGDGKIIIYGKNHIMILEDDDKILDIKEEKNISKVFYQEEKLFIIYENEIQVIDL